MKLLIEIDQDKLRELLKSNALLSGDIVFVAEDTGHIAEITAQFALISQAKKDIGEMYKKLDTLWTQQEKS